MRRYKERIKTKLERKKRERDEENF